MARDGSRRRGAPGGRRSRGEPVSNRKDAQLCAQVAEEIGLTLAASRDEDLNGVWVMGVEPYPNVGHLRVVVQAAQGTDEDRVHEKLAANLAYLRQEVAESISRKKVPNISFVVLPATPPKAPIE